MAHAQAFGSSLSIVKFNGSVDVEFDKVGLESLLLHPEVRNRKVVILSIVGAFRKGKSFFLDYCLRFLYAHVSSEFEFSL
jgi:atlastin